ncbi:hypothetical protein SSE37_23709 [Sagittula stellata E-37]|uniref:Uncharacterized protein n=1 Tax=Sagittula stellata (strain ATCC 700073 / DSM 11524 / E-37) TaxID=388399 RepID=A3K0I7_SAGS3|nr:hypothetical protein SSE37_23709 [Sagittula stellata E-37]
MPETLVDGALWQQGAPFLFLYLCVGGQVARQGRVNAKDGA